MNIGRAVDGATARLRAVAPRPAGELERQLRVALKELAAAQAALEQAEAEEHDLDAAHVDHFLGTIEPAAYDRRVAEVQRRLVEARHEVGRWQAIVAGVRAKAIDAVEEANTAEADAVIAERAKLALERERLLAKVAEIDRDDARLAAKADAIDESRLPALARFDQAAAEALQAREKAREDEATQIAHRKIRGEDVEVPEELAALVREHEPLIRADIAEREREQREHFRRIGALPLAEYEQTGGPAVRDPNLGFSDPDEE